MAIEDTVPSPTKIGTVFPVQVAVNYPKAVGSIAKFSDIQVYTVADIWRMVEFDLKNAGVSVVPFDQFAFFLREILNDYSEKVGEFQIALCFEGGGSLFRIPSIRDIVTLDVNGYGATKASEDIMTKCRATGTTLRTNEFYYSLNGNLLSVYPALGDSDIITIFAITFAEDFNEESSGGIILPVDNFALYHGVRWKCRELYGKDYLGAMRTYLLKRNERKSRVERQLYPSQLRSPNIL